MLQHWNIYLFIIYILFTHLSSLGRALYSLFFLLRLRKKMIFHTLFMSYTISELLVYRMWREMALSFHENSIWSMFAPPTLFPSLSHPRITAYNKWTHLLPYVSSKFSSNPLFLSRLPTATRWTIPYHSNYNKFTIFWDLFNSNTQASLNLGAFFLRFLLFWANTCPKARISPEHH